MIRSGTVTDADCAAGRGSRRATPRDAAKGRERIVPAANGHRIGRGPDRTGLRLETPNRRPDPVADILAVL